jgi:hypothetical protein
MKKTFLHFGHAPKIYSHRFRGASFPGSASYKSDGGNGDEGGEGDEKKEITKEFILKELGEIKTGLEKKAKEEVTEQVTEQLKAVNTSIEELKSKAPEVSVEEFKKVKSDLDVTIKAFDQLQIILKDRKAPITEKAKTFNEALGETIKENADKIKNFKKEARKFGWK